MISNVAEMVKRKKYEGKSMATSRGCFYFNTELITRN